MGERNIHVVFYRHNFAVAVEAAAHRFVASEDVFFNQDSERLILATDDFASGSLCK